MAGLVAAHELVRAGHEVEVIEARSRVGGRIYTMREPFTHGLYAEAGAMRIPRGHHLTLDYVERFGLPTRLFRVRHPQAWSVVHGRRFHLDEAVRLDLGFELEPQELAEPYDQIVQRAFEPAVARLATADAVAERELDAMSIRTYLRGSHWSEGAIDRFGVFSGHESLMETSVLEFLRGTNSMDAEMVSIPGGMDRLPRFFLDTLGPRIHFGTELCHIDQDGHGVRFHTSTLGGRRTFQGDYAIVTIPLSVLRHIEFDPVLSPRKERAIRQVHYEQAGKIFVQFRHRFWEDEGIDGGLSITTAAIRHVIYPGPWFDGDVGTRGILVASYTWAQDALRWSPL